MVSWRYDPICFWLEDGRPRNSWDPQFFERMCAEVSRLGVRRCFTSFADRYAKYEQRVRRLRGIALRDPSPEEAASIAGEMAAIAHSHGVQLLACTEPLLAACDGFAKGACIDGRLLKGPIAAATDRRMRGREECGCTLHVDIGDYASQECGDSCIYCYANPNYRRFVTRARRPGEAEQRRTQSTGTWIPPTAS